jgi:hypothetical protein
MLRALVAVMLAAAGSAADVELYTYKTTDPALTVVAPADWTALGKSAGAALILRSPVAEGASPSESEGQASIAVTTEALEKELTVEQYSEQCKEALRRMFADFTIVDEELLSLHGRPWYQVHYRFRTGQLVWEQKLLLSINKKIGWCVTYSCSAASWERWQDLFQNISAQLGAGR